MSEQSVRLSAREPKKEGADGAKILEELKEEDDEDEV